MADTTIYQQTSDGFKSVIAYDEYLSNRKSELLGIRHELVQLKHKKEVKQPDGSIVEIEEAVKEQLPDGSWQDVWEDRIVNSTEATRLVNEEGADYITRNLRKFFNKHSAMGDLRTNEECAKIAARAVQSIYAHIEANCEIYGVSVDKFSALEGEFDTDMSSVYLLLTSMRDHGLRGFGEGTQKGNYTGSSSGTEEQPRRGLLG